MKTAFRPIRLRALPALFAAGLLAGGACSPLSAQTTVNWNGGTGNWNDASLWSTGAVPDGAGFNVYIDGGKTGVNSVVSMDGNYTVGSLTLDTNDTLNFLDGTQPTLTNTLTNNGTINFNSDGSGDVLHLAGPTTFSGSGTIKLNGYNNRIVSNTAGDRLTIGAGQTIAGSGNLGGGSTTFTNNGIVSASVIGLMFNIQPGGGAGDFTNNGYLLATNHGVLQFFDASGGKLTNNGNFNVGGGATATVPAGALTNLSGTTLTGGAYGVSSASANSPSTLSLTGGSIVTNNATIILDGPGSVFDAVNSLAINGSNGFFGVTNGRAFTTAGALTNAGEIDVSGNSRFTVSGTLNNSGLTEVESSSIATILGNVTNSGTLAATAGTLHVQGTVTNSGALQVGFSGGTGVVGISGMLTQSATGILLGSGFFNASSFSLAGSVRPGDSAFAQGVSSAVGKLGFNGNVALQGNTALIFDLATVTASDQIAVNGALTLDGTLTVNALAGFGVGRYELIDYNGALTDNGLNLGTLPAGYNYAIDTSIAGQVDLVVTNAVPEPSVWAAVLGGCGTLALVLRRRASRF